MLAVFLSFFFSYFCLAEVPRFVVLRSHKVNMHVGPGKHYPVTWQYTCLHLPLEIIAEFDDWRFVRDSEGVKGWIHRSLLTGKRFARVLHAQMVYKKPDLHPIAYVAKGVIGRIVASTPTWCCLEFRLAHKKIKGWVKRNTWWGLYKQEEF